MEISQPCSECATLGKIVRHKCCILVSQADKYYQPFARAGHGPRRFTQDSTTSLRSVAASCFVWKPYKPPLFYLQAIFATLNLHTIKLLVQRLQEKRQFAHLVRFAQRQSCLALHSAAQVLTRRPPVFASSHNNREINLYGSAVGPTLP